MSILVKSNFDKIRKQIVEDAKESTVEIAQSLIDISNNAYTPKKTGALAESGHVQETFKGTAIVYDADYAARLYMGFVNNYNKDVNHLAGPFWIDRAAAGNREFILDIVAKKIGGDL